MALILGLNGVRQNFASANLVRSYSSTAGVVEKSQVIYRKGYDVHAKHDVATKTWELEYSFVVDGKEYRGEDYKFGMGMEISADSRLFDGLAAKYPPGQECTVFYNAAKPGSRPVLTKEVELTGFIIGAVFWAGALTCFLVNIWLGVQRDRARAT